MKKSINIFLKLLGFFVFLVLLLFMSLNFLENYKNKKIIQSFSQNIENFYVAHKRLPESWEDMGLPKERDGMWYYEKLRNNPNYYKIYKNIGFDDIFIYYSDTKKFGGLENRSSND